MSANDIIETEGEVLEVLKGGLFRVRIDNGHKIICHPSGKMRKNKISIVPGDKVKVAMSPYDMTKGRITYRVKG